MLDLTSVNPVETEKSLDRLVFEGYGRADSVKVDGLKKSQHATGKMRIKSEIIGGKTVTTLDVAESIAKHYAIAFCDNREGFISPLVQSGEDAGPMGTGTLMALD